MSYLVVMKIRLRIFDELSIPVPMSHLMPELEARRWMLNRGMSASCEIMCEDRFNALNGRVSKAKEALNKIDALGKL